MGVVRGYIKRLAQNGSFGLPALPSRLPVYVPFFRSPPSAIFKGTSCFHTARARHHFSKR